MTTQMATAAGAETAASEDPPAYEGGALTLTSGAEPEVS